MSFRFSTGVIVEFRPIDFMNCMAIEGMYALAIRESKDSRDAENKMIETCVRQVLHPGPYIEVHNGIDELTIQFNALTFEDIKSAMDEIVRMVGIVKAIELPLYRNLQRLHLQDYELAVKMYQSCLGLCELNNSERARLYYRDISEPNGDISDATEALIFRMMVMENFALRMVERKGLGG